MIAAWGSDHITHLVANTLREPVQASGFLTSSCLFHRYRRRCRYRRRRRHCGRVCGSEIPPLPHHHPLGFQCTMDPAEVALPTFGLVYRAIRGQRLDEVVTALALGDAAAHDTPGAGTAATATGHLRWFTPSLLRLCMAADWQRQRQKQRPQQCPTVDSHGPSVDSIDASVAALYPAALQDPLAASLLAYQTCDFVAIAQDLRAATAPWAKLPPGRVPPVSSAEWDPRDFEGRWTPANRVRFVVLEVLRMAAIVIPHHTPPSDCRASSSLRMFASLFLPLPDLPLPPTPRLPFPGSPVPSLLIALARPCPRTSLS